MTVREPRQIIKEVLARCYEARGNSYLIIANENFNIRAVAEASSVKVLMNRFIPELESLSAELGGK